MRNNPILHFKSNPKTPLKTEITSSESQKQNIIEVALQEKEKGNQFFKQNKFSQAIQCYSKAIQLDPHNPILPANRAMAHLRLGNFLEAELDCNEALQRDPNFVKAYARRAAARKELKKFQEAAQDFQKVLQFEKMNTQAQEELTIINNLLEQQKEDIRFQKKKEEQLQSITKSQSVVQVMTELTPPITPIPPIIETSLPQIIETPLPQLITQESQSKNQVRKSETFQPRKLDFKEQLLTEPKTAYNFERTWEACKNDLDSLHKLFQMIKPENYPALLKDLMTPAILNSILQVIQKFYLSSHDYSQAIKMLTSLTMVSRFDMVVMFLSEADKQVVRNIFDTLSLTQSQTQMELLMGKFGIK